ncbi:hypothetical protein ABAC460_17275 [Asticcacaulis sp. AC460]|uniref:restriction endonuclease n=1 Tax=Asticcacaulis sp. AC460 TaxID=1282360 RepID=UPI0003C3EA69|nr:restriction endonuclease [Asticcacaulis sp. AC460]ESQ87943.1 hypothetical protein ABAC460_17275 [Asticcacaulis sp. AC460]
MARRKSPDLADWVRALSVVPPFITLPVGIIAYLVLHYFAMKTVAVGAGSAETAAADAATATVLRALALVFQYLIPFVLGMSGLLWLVRWFEKRRVRKLADAAGSSEVLASISWADFERIVAHAFTKHGFDAQLTPEGADGGIDVVLHRGEQKFLVQAKHWRAKAVDVETVRALYGVMHAEGAVGAYVVTSGVFTKAAGDFAKDKSIWLYNGQRLRDLLKQGRDALPGGNLTLDRLPARVGEGVECPLCASPMTLRIAKQGGHQGERFFGCTTYPDCAGLRPVD